MGVVWLIRNVVFLSIGMRMFLSVSFVILSVFIVWGWWRISVKYVLGLVFFLI